MVRWRPEVEAESESEFAEEKMIATPVNSVELGEAGARGGVKDRRVERSG